MMTIHFAVGPSLAIGQFTTLEGNNPDPFLQNQAAGRMRLIVKLYDICAG